MSFSTKCDRFSDVKSAIAYYWYFFLKCDRLKFSVLLGCDRFSWCDKCDRLLVIFLGAIA
ncbi:hypothetical protein [Gloeocapsopsis sp. IPPAS B-1203]|uniref:hypothetical protein n=1 Tax=Gloeocapsopsis sp. IPPAS B-1203 TaxID=2049454 RepID=UPI0011816FFB|nr:hypothetical protein [Gloeocapsopsis sp. IPPAS B-1203]